MNGHKHARLIPSVLDLDLSALSLPDNRVRPPVGPVVNLIRQSIILRRFFFFAMDARVRFTFGPASSRTRMPAHD
ncbi:MAG: hypothetical protein K8H87_11880, partial [Pseudorhodoplanes sp.]|nr:hypothetical protein [Pseudorhodoplanes sp.]